MKHVPIVQFRKPSPDDPAKMRGLVLVASRDIQDGEEVFLDYKLQLGAGSGEPPEWYVPVPKVGTGPGEEPAAAGSKRAAERQATLDLSDTDNRF
jgi:hypothetical protein